MELNPAESRPAVHPLLALFFGILSVSTAAIFIRYAQDDAPSLVIAAYRLVMASLILAPIALSRHFQEIRALSGRQLALALLSGFFLALHFATWITSLEYTTVASSVVLVTTTPLWVALLSPIFLQERLTRPVLIGMGFALLGGVIVGLNDACVWQNSRLSCPTFAEMVRGQAFLGDILALTGAWMAAAYLIIGRRLRGGISLLGYIFVVYSISAVVLVFLALLAGQSLVGYPPRVYGWFLLLALIPQLLGHSIFNWALRYLSAGYVSITLLGEPIGSTILAYFLLNEAPTWLKVFGAILILLGIYLASLGESRRLRR